MCLCLVLAGCSGSSAGPKMVLGPSATIAVPVDVSGPFVWRVDSPIYDKSGAGKLTIDPRVLVAVEAPDRATWVVASRVDAAGGLELVEAMTQTLRGASAATEHVLQLTIEQPLPQLSSPGRADLRGGQWRWQGGIERGTMTCYVMNFVDQHGTLRASVVMDAATARDLMLRLSRTIRAAPARFSLDEQ